VSGGMPVMPLLVSWSPDSAGVMYSARRPSDGTAGYHTETISSRACTPGTHGSGREVSVSHTEAAPARHGPVGSGRPGLGPRPAGAPPASAEVPMPPIITAARALIKCKLSGWLTRCGSQLTCSGGRQRLTSGTDCHIQQ
jgi:hypothetical protein